VATLTGQVTTLTAEKAALQSQVTTLTAQNAALVSQVSALQAQLAAVGPTLTSLMLAVFGDKPDLRVALVAGDLAQLQIAAAQQKAPNDSRLRQAQQSYDSGMEGLQAGDWWRAVQRFRDAYNTADAILSQASAPARGHDKGNARRIR
jgi:hypothetical protein